jgi:hypothetical protein
MPVKAGATELIPALERVLCKKCDVFEHKQYSAKTRLACLWLSLTASENAQWSVEVPVERSAPFYRFGITIF